MTSTQTLVFTDMDGTLLDHNTYSYESAKPALEALAQQQIPVVPTTSKTYAEMLVLRKTIGLNGPFIVENGAAVFIPHNFFDQKPAGTVWQDGFWCKSFISSKHHWLQILEQIKADFDHEFTHFSAMSLDQIQQATGLNEDDARRAARRQYGEPVLWQGEASGKQAFIEAISARGGYPLQGGRFIHISGNCDKGQALQWLCNEYQRQNKVRTQSVALGDGKNDIAMLEAADIAIRILSPNHAPPELQKQEQVYTSTLHGPAGWNETLTTLLSLPI